MESVHHREEIIHIPTDSHSPPTMKTEESDMSGSCLDVRFDMSVNEKLEFSRNLTPSNQSKKELYVKLDELLITSLHEAFEVHPGATVDRVEMVEFLSNVVKKSLSTYPDLEKILCLRDTVLTARVKRAFPEVEYKRKQIRQDHFRKAWLYVNIRRKPGLNLDNGDINSDNNCATVRLEAHTRTPSNKICVSTTGTWTPEAPVRHPSPDNILVKKKQTPLNTQLPSTVDHPPETSRKSTEVTKPKHYRGSKSNSNSNYKKLAPMPSTESASMVTGFSIRESSAVVLDNYTIIKWVKMNYVEDNTSYVPVQDVVKAFKISYGIDITYKECHQMIYSAFTSPRQRTCPLKTVRVSSMGAQYVYRGIAPVRPNKNGNIEDEDCVEDYSPELIVHSDVTQEEREEIWKKVVEEVKQERDQLIQDRNQALSALMDLEKEHVHALTVIEQQRKDLDLRTVDKNLAGKSGSSSSGESSDLMSRVTQLHYARFSGTSASKAESNMLSALAPTCEHCNAEKQTYDHLKDERDQIWKDIVQQGTIENEEGKKRLEMVKRERDVYLERLHSLEKENQRLRDSVAVPYSPPLSISTHNQMSSMQAIKLENRAQALRNSIQNTDSRDQVKNSRDSLNNVLSHLRSKRKQSTPTKFSKVPRLSNSENDGHPEPYMALKENVASPTFVDIRSPSQDDQFCFDKFHRVQDTHLTAPSQEKDKGLYRSPTSIIDPNEMLLYFEGSDMVAFKPHPMED